MGSTRARAACASPPSVPNRHIRYGRPTSVVPTAVGLPAGTRRCPPSGRTFGVADRPGWTDRSGLPGPDPAGHNGGMSARRVVVLGTGVVLAALAGVFVVVGWDRAIRISTVVSALAAVAAVGVAVWAAWPVVRSRSDLSRRPRSEPELTVRVSGSGTATARGHGSSVSGASGPATSAPNRVEAVKTGDADASGGGDATSGIRWT